MIRLLGGGSDLSTVVNDMNTNLLDLKGREVTQVFKDDNGNPRVILGKAPDGTYGLKVSKDGYNVTSASNDQLVFNSSQNTLKVILTDTMTVTKNASSDFKLGTYNHNLGYIPSYQAYIDGLSDSGDPARFTLPYITFPSVGTDVGKIMLKVEMYCTDADVKIRIYTPQLPSGSGFYASALTYQIKFYLFQETAV